MGRGCARSRVPCLKSCGHDLNTGEGGRELVSGIVLAAEINGARGEPPFLFCVFEPQKPWPPRSFRFIHQMNLVASTGNKRTTPSAICITPPPFPRRLARRLISSTWFIEGGRCIFRFERQNLERRNWPAERAITGLTCCPLIFEIRAVPLKMR